MIHRRERGQPNTIRLTGLRKYRSFADGFLNECEYRGRLREPLDQPPAERLNRQGVAQRGIRRTVDDHLAVGR